MGLVLLLYQFHLTVATDTATCGPKSLHRNARIVLMTVSEIAITLAIDSAGFGSRHAAPSLSGLQLSTAPTRTAAAPSMAYCGMTSAFSQIRQLVADSTTLPLQQQRWQQPRRAHVPAQLVPIVLHVQPQPTRASRCICNATGRRGRPRKTEQPADDGDAAAAEQPPRAPSRRGRRPASAALPTEQPIPLQVWQL